MGKRTKKRQVIETASSVSSISEAIVKRFFNSYFFIFLFWIFIIISVSKSNACINWKILYMLIGSLGLTVSTKFWDDSVREKD